MSSATSTDVAAEPAAHDGLQPWQFFVLAGLGCATASVFIARGQGLMAIVMTTILMASITLVGIAALRMVRPLVTREDDRTAMVGHRTRLALEREKLLVLRTIKELEFDHAMGKLSDVDYQEMATRLRSRAGRLIRDLDAGSGYRDQIERDLVNRLGQTPSPTSAPVCAACSTTNDSDARFCKSCGAKL